MYSNKGERLCRHFKNALNSSVYAVFRAFFTLSLAKFRLFYSLHQGFVNVKSIISKTCYCTHDLYLLKSSEFYKFTKTLIARPSHSPSYRFSLMLFAFSQLFSLERITKATHNNISYLYIFTF